MAPPLKEKREEVKEGRRGDGKGREGKGAWKAHVVRRRCRAHLAFLGRGRTPILFSLRGDPWPHTCSSPLQVQALIANSSHTHTQHQIIFHTLCKDFGWGVGGLWKRRSYSPCFFFLHAILLPFYCWGLKIQTCRLVCVVVLVLSGFYFFGVAEIIFPPENGCL